MRTPPIRLVLAFLVGCGATGASAGPLNPPAGPVDSTLRTLDEICPAVSIESLPGDAFAVHVIVDPGVYQLTRPLDVPPGMDAIRIEVGGVSCDLNGFEVRGMPGSGNGIRCDVPPGVGCDVRLIDVKASGLGGDAISFAPVTVPGGSVEIRGLDVRETFGRSVAVDDMPESRIVIAGPRMYASGGISVNGANSRLYVRDAILSEIIGDGIAHAGSETVIEDSSIGDCSDDCVDLDPSDQPGLVDADGDGHGVSIRVERCTLYDSVGDGLRVTPVTPGRYDVHVRDVSVVSSGGGGFTYVPVAGGTHTVRVRTSDLSANGGDGVHLRTFDTDATAFYLDRTTAHSNAGDGVDAEAMAGGAVLGDAHLHLHRCAVIGNNGHGVTSNIYTSSDRGIYAHSALSGVSVRLRTTRPSYVSLRGDTLYANGDDGLTCEPPATVADVYAGDNGRHGIRFGRSQPVMVETFGARCYLENNAMSGVSATDTRVVLVDTTSTANAEHGVRCDGGSVELRNCHCDDNTQSGCSVSNATCGAGDSTARGNGAGGFVCDSSDTSLSQCDASGNTGDGYSATGGTMTCGACTATGNSGAGFRCSGGLGSGDGFGYSDCRSIGNGAGGWSCTGAQVRLNNCEASGNTGSGVDCSSSVCFATDCVMASNTSNGFICASGRHSLSACVAYANQNSGFVFVDSRGDAEQCDGMDNDCDGFDDDGGLGSFTDCRAIGNGCSGFSTAPSAMASPRVSYIGCYASQNFFDGFSQSDNDRGATERCEAINNVETGFRCSGADNASLIDCRSNGNLNGFQIFGGAGTLVIRCSAGGNVAGNYTIDPGHVVGPIVGAGAIAGATNPTSNMEH